ncbi:pyrimidine dimer DNA glycosylase/endonuclease V [Candidatus Micrarchaeota archaeon]|nr:pyrimidine dimer DNA glycosylase/endonuclease V [Candidatus Micrarchaeota archaeon]MBU1166664.1 pyrimidine dimer DNA glycosylase/endonuclease V [Candidatus Micrarchaeota archaeon]MBU1886621.1 pyrimidine dimer DNA glycosylase/endonuclease V [Candidatus Micrarchaeota archaeon]
MRIWDISPSKLCRQHLLGEHRELHAIWSILINGKKGYSKHPETLRWNGKLLALYTRHKKLVNEMKKRGYNHNSDLEYSLARGGAVQKVFIDSPADQLKLLKRKRCRCTV